MSLPAPVLDDRTYQDLVDDAKRHVQRRCPAWSDHNLSDPGVTLIETFAYMVDQVRYRLDRVPDRLYVAFLELLGIHLAPRTAARADLTFWLSTPRPDPVVVPAGASVATPRQDEDPGVAFSTLRALTVVPCSFAVALSLGPPEGGERPHRRFAEGEGFACFSDVPRPDDEFLVGLSAPVPDCAVELDISCSVSGLGIDPDDPPIRWEALTRSGWRACEVDVDRSDDIAGLNRSGRLVLHVPAEHVSADVSGRRAAWLRCRVVVSVPGQPAYAATPRVDRLRAATLGGTVVAHHAEVVRGEVLGRSDGTAGQRFAISRGPVVWDGGDGWELEVQREDDQGWDVWQSVEHFADSAPDDSHFSVDPAAGEVHLGPVVRQADGALRRYGRRVPHGLELRLRSYAVGGGQSGNVAQGRLTVMRSSVQHVAAVVNRRAAGGGVDGEALEDVVRRGPLELHSRDRAVTAEDFELWARRADPRVRRVRCVAEPGASPVVRVLVVPAPRTAGRMTLADLELDDDLAARVTAELDRRRLVGTQVVVEPPPCVQVVVLALLEARGRAEPERVQRDAVAALERYFDPVSGGPGGDGWPFGRPVLAGEAHAVLQAVPGVKLVQDVRLAEVNPETGRPRQATARIDLLPAGVVVSAQHQVRVER